MAIPGDVSLPQIEQDISKREAELTRWQTALAADEAEWKGRAGRRAKIPEQLTAAQKRLADINAELQASATGSESSPEYSARRFLLLAQRRTAEQEILCCQKELAAYEARTELLPLCRDLDARQVALAEQEIKQWRDFVNRRRQQEAEQQVRQAAWEAGQAHPAVRRLAEENAALAAKRKQLAQRIVETTRQQEQVNQQLTALKEQFKRLQEKVEATGKTHATNAIGLYAAEAARGASQPARVPPRTSACRRQTIGEGQLAMLELQDNQSALADLDLQTQAVMQSLNVAEQAGNRAELEAAVHEALKTERDYLDDLIDDHNTYFNKLVDLANAEQQLIDETERCGLYIDQRVLWIASTTPMSADDVRWAGDALWWLAGPDGLARRGPDAGGRRRAEPAHFRPGAVRLSRAGCTGGRGFAPAFGRSAKRRRGGVAAATCRRWKPRCLAVLVAVGWPALDVVFRLAAQLGRRGLGVVQGPGRRIAGHRPRVPGPGTAAADVLGGRTGRGPFRLVLRGHATAPAEHPLVQSAGACC